MPASEQRMYPLNAGFPATNTRKKGFSKRFLCKKQDCQGQWPSFSFILALSFLSTSKRVIVSPSPYKQQLMKYLFLYHYTCTIIIRNRWYKLGFEHTTLWLWVRCYTPKLQARIHPIWMNIHIICMSTLWHNHLYQMKDFKIRYGCLL